MKITESSVVLAFISWLCHRGFEAKLLVSDPSNSTFNPSSINTHTLPRHKQPPLHSPKGSHSLKTDHKYYVKEILKELTQK